MNGTPAALGSIFVTAFIIGFSGAMMPGPLLTFTIGESARRGAWAGPVLMLGHMLLELALVVAIALGLGVFLQNAAVINGIAIGGGAVMGWMGLGMLRSCRRLALPDAAVTESAGLHPVAAGALMSLANPYWTLWWATIGLTYILTGLAFGVAGLVVFFAGHILSDFAWYTLVSVAVARGSRIMSNRVYRSLIGVCGGAIVLFGVFFASRGIGFFSVS